MSSEAMILAVMNAIYANCVKKPENFGTSRYRCDALTNWARKPLTLGAGHLWVPVFPWGMNQRWNDMWNGSYMNCGYEIKWSYDPRSCERNFCNCLKKPEKFRTSFHRWSSCHHGSFLSSTKHYRWSHLDRNLGLLAASVADLTIEELYTISASISLSRNGGLTNDC